jgi:hypothetical protein
MRFSSLNDPSDIVQCSPASEAAHKEKRNKKAKSGNNYKKAHSLF